MDGWLYRWMDGWMDLATQTSYRFHPPPLPTFSLHIAGAASLYFGGGWKSGYYYRKKAGHARV